MSEAQSASLVQGSGAQNSIVLGSGTAHSAPGAQAMLGVGAVSVRHSQFFGQVWSPHASARATALTARGTAATKKDKLTRTQGRRVCMQGLLCKFAAGSVPAPKIGSFRACARSRPSPV
jgi:hypothetical protein